MVSGPKLFVSQQIVTMFGRSQVFSSVECLSSILQSLFEAQLISAIFQPPGAVSGFNS